MTKAILVQFNDFDEITNEDGYLLDNITASMNGQIDAAKRMDVSNRSTENGAFIRVLLEDHPLIQKGLE